jgi:hypothetical protein
MAEQRRRTEGGVREYDNRYCQDPASLASQGLDELLAGFTEILDAGGAAPLPARTASV